MVQARKELRSANLLPVGRIAYANEDGFLPWIGYPDAIAPWAEPLRAVCEATRDVLPEKIEAILLRGSIPRSTASAGASDLITVHAGEIGAEERARPSECGQAIAADFPDVTEVELLTIPETEFWSERRWEWLRFILSHQGLTLHGIDLIARLPPPRLDRRAVVHDRPGARWMSKWEGHWRDARTEAERRSVCSWLMILRFPVRDGRDG
ncbi:hypothetical protein [Aureimonas sp. AU20]|uniref:hypothetical protein n=1 Tax=Aureimonas sp. AU20 TaxID=1349819 RepID=UPI000722EEDA|nr:hypothetical protein [Aureimonas sp. AU20]ALN75065.1 hypothetical protein M673_20255 [Aureimonas sp. AU20]